MLIRPQIPHVGELRLLEHARVALDGAIGKLSDHVNLKVGEAKKLSVTTAQEEGFAGEIAITAEGLPEGVRLLPATEVKPDAGPHRDEGQKERYVPKTEKATLILVAAANAPLTRMPQPHPGARPCRRRGQAWTSPVSRRNSIDGGATLKRSLLAGVMALGLIWPLRAEERPFSFARDIGGILTKQGCNNSDCHGSVKGRGGLKLSANALYPKEAPARYRAAVDGGG